MISETWEVFIADVPRGKRARFFTQKSCAKAEAKARYFEKHPCECEDETFGLNGGSHGDGNNCGCYDERAIKTRARLARWILRAFRKERS